MLVLTANECKCPLFPTSFFSFSFFLHMLLEISFAHSKPTLQTLQTRSQTGKSEDSNHYEKGTVV